MARKICLDGVTVSLDADRVEVELGARQSWPADHDDEREAGAPCACAAHWQPVMSYADGTTVFLHEGPEGYRVEGPRPHRWVVTFMDEGSERVARLNWEAAS